MPVAEVRVTGRTTHVRFHFHHIHVSNRPTLGMGTPQWIPAVDLYETDDEVIFEVELGGVTSDDVRVQITGRTVCLSGSRHPRAESPVTAFHVMEIERGEFLRTVELPALVEPDTVRAKFTDGLLVVRACKRGGAMHGCRKARNREGLE